MKVLADRGVKDQKQQLESARSILAQEKLIEEAAKKANIAQDPAVKALIAERQTEIYSAELVRKNAAAHPLTDADLKKTYEEVKKQYDPNEIKVRHILVKTEQEAKDIIKSLNAGGDFATNRQRKIFGSGYSSSGRRNPVHQHPQNRYPRICRNCNGSEQRCSSSRSFPQRTRLPRYPASGQA